jgi:hypothetical protein
VYFIILYLEQLFLSVICKSINLSKSQLNKINRILQETPKLFNSSHILKISKPISYLTFILKEIYDFSAYRHNPENITRVIEKRKKELEKLKLISAKIEALIN